MNELYWGAVFFYDSKSSIGEVLFFNQFYWSEFWSGKWNTWKILERFCCWTKWRVERKESGFLFISLFSREREIEVWKKNLLASEILCSRAAFYSGFLPFFGSEVWLWFSFNFRLVLVVVWRFLETYMNFMLIGGFSCILLIFGLIFAIFWLLFCFTASNGYWKKPYYLSNF